MCKGFVSIILNSSAYDVFIDSWRLVHYWALVWRHILKCEKRRWPETTLQRPQYQKKTLLNCRFYLLRLCWSARITIFRCPNSSEFWTQKTASGLSIRMSDFICTIGPRLWRRLMRSKRALWRFKLWNVLDISGMDITSSKLFNWLKNNISECILLVD